MLSVYRECRSKMEISQLSECFKRVVIVGKVAVLKCSGKSYFLKMKKLAAEKRGNYTS